MKNKKKNKQVVANKKKKVWQRRLRIISREIKTMFQELEVWGF